MKYEDGEGPVRDIEAAKRRAKIERDKPEHQYRPDHTGRDPRDVGLDEADLADPEQDGGPDD